MRLTVTTFVTLDGVVQGPGGVDEDRDGGFEWGGWMVPFVDDELTGIAGDRLGLADAILLGRHTYDMFAESWPKMQAPDDPIATSLNGLPKYVASTTLTDPTWPTTTVLTDVVGQVRALKEQPGRELQVHGSGNLLRTLIAHDMVDEYRLWLVPVVLGVGKRLFQEGLRPAGLRLVDSFTTGKGVSVLTYEPTGAPPALGYLGP
jgi:dihydrofolate reductase